MTAEPLTLRPSPLTPDGFATFGEVLQVGHGHNFPINDGRCQRYHDLAEVQCLGEEARPMISLFRSQPVTLPLTLSQVERHPLGSQAFMPLSGHDWLVTACKDSEIGPQRPQVFLASGQQGINFHANVWHGVLSPLHSVSDFLVVDRDGKGKNVEIFDFPSPYQIIVP